MLDSYRIKALRLWLRDYRWIHTGIGLLGNGAFLAGSVFFLWESLKTAGIWLFIIGATGMFIGSLGDALSLEADKQ